MLRIAQPNESPSSPHDAARPDYVGFLHRAPFAYDAARLGYATGVREDYSLRVPIDSMNVPPVVVDNDFENADRERYAARLARYDPTPAVGIVADVETVDEVQDAVAYARDLRADLGVEPVVVPKSKAALEALPRDVIAGYPNAKHYSGTHADEYTRASDWAGHRVHILGGSPQRQLTAIEALTGYNTTENASLAAFATDSAFDPEAVANVVGADWNGCHRVAYRGERWTPSKPHWVPADSLSIRETVRRSLTAAKRYWRSRDLWPGQDLRDAYGPVYDPPERPRDNVCAGCGRDLFGDDVHDVHEDLEGVVRAYCSELCRDRLRFRAGVEDSPDGNRYP